MNQSENLTCPDGYVIGTVRYEPRSAIKAEVLMAGATAVPQGFYKRFAEFANQQGYAVTTLDYRGVGASAPQSLRGFKTNYIDWGRQDLATVLEHIKRQNPDRATYMVGHSFGGHGFGLMPNHDKVDAFYTFASGAGWAGHMPRLEQFRVNLLWKLLGPVSVGLLGYLPGRFIGGEPLPKDVFEQWKHWCSFPNYFFDDPAMGVELQHFSKVTTPIAAVTALDDLWAPPISRDHFFRGYIKAPLTAIDLDPAKLGYPIGHMGYFRKGREALWDSALQWCASRPAAPTAL